MHSTSLIWLALHGLPLLTLSLIRSSKYLSCISYLHRSIDGRSRARSDIKGAACRAETTASPKRLGLSSSSNLRANLRKSLLWHYSFHSISNAVWSIVFFTSSNHCRIIGFLLEKAPGSVLGCFERAYPTTRDVPPSSNCHHDTFAFLHAREFRITE